MLTLKYSHYNEHHKQQYEVQAEKIFQTWILGSAEVSLSMQAMMFIDVYFINYRNENQYSYIEPKHLLTDCNGLMEKIIINSSYHSLVVLHANLFFNPFEINQNSISTSPDICVWTNFWMTFQEGMKKISKAVSDLRLK